MDAENFLAAVPISSRWVLSGNHSVAIVCMVKLKFCFVADDSLLQCSWPLRIGFLCPRHSVEPRAQCNRDSCFRLHICLYKTKQTVGFAMIGHLSDFRFPSLPPPPPLPFTYGLVQKLNLLCLSILGLVQKSTKKFASPSPQPIVVSSCWTCHFHPFWVLSKKDGVSTPTHGLVRKPDLSFSFMLSLVQKRCPENLSCLV